MLSTLPDCNHFTLCCPCPTRPYTLMSSTTSCFPLQPSLLTGPAPSSPSPSLIHTGPSLRFQHECQRSTICLQVGMQKQQWQQHIAVAGSGLQATKPWLQGAVFLLRPQVALLCSVWPSMLTSDMKSSVKLPVAQFFVLFFKQTGVLALFSIGWP